MKFENTREKMVWKFILCVYYVCVYIYLVARAKTRPVAWLRTSQSRCIPFFPDAPTHVSISITSPLQNSPCDDFFPIVTVWRWDHIKIFQENFATNIWIYRWCFSQIGDLLNFFSICTSQEKSSLKKPKTWLKKTRCCNDYRIVYGD